ncbi:MAG: YIP1 family protein [Acidobacteria bacterium]|nr:YIP1 family protein [Acidobacteriota bacterium]
MEVSPAAPAPQQKISDVSRIYEVLISPKETFEDIVRTPSWVLAVVLVSICSLGVSLLFTQRVGWERFFNKLNDKNPRFARLDPDQQKRVLEGQLKFSGVSTYVIPAFVPIFALVLALIYWVSYKLVAGSPATFKTSLAITAHSFMQGLVSTAIAVAVLLFQDPEAVDLQNLNGLNAGSLLSSNAPLWQQGLAGSIDVFSFWTMFLVATGFAATAPKKISFGKAFGVVFGLWAVKVFVSTSWAAMFS